MVHAVKAPSDVGLARRIAMVAYTEYASDPRVRREAETLVAEGHRVEAIVLRPRSGPSAAELDGVHLHEVPLSARRGGGMRYLYQYAVFFLLSSLLLFRLYRRVRFNLIYIHSLPDFQVFCALPFKCMRIPVLLDLHEPMPEIVVARLRRPTGSAWFRISAAIERLSCLLADHVIVANDGIRDAVVSRRVSPSRVTTVYNVYEVGPRPVSPEGGRRRLGLPEGRLLVHAGGVSPERDLATLVEAVALLPGHDDIHLVIAGEGAPEYIEALRGLAHHLASGTASDLYRRCSWNWRGLLSPFPKLALLPSNRTRSPSSLGRHGSSNWLPSESRLWFRNSPYSRRCCEMPPDITHLGTRRA